MHTTYHKRMGEYSSPDEELTFEQIYAVHTRLKVQRPAYIDFALLGPHGQRILRELNSEAAASRRTVPYTPPRSGPARFRQLDAQLRRH